MAIQMINRKHTIHVIVILVVSVSTCRSNFHECDVDNNDDLFTQVHNKPELGHDFQAYPSYLDTNFIEGSNDNEDQIHGFNYNIEQVEYGSALIDVSSFGAKGDGNTDDTTAFEKAWKEACSSNTPVLFVVHHNKNYLLKQITFSGPCRSSISMQVFGSLEAYDNISFYSEDRRHWILFNDVQDLVVVGGGIINGNGKIWWQNSCKINKSLPCKIAPTALTFYNCKKLKVKNLKIKDAQQIHVSFERCTNVEASNLMITASENSPNTDGIHIANTQNIQISDSTIGTGDDCISIESGSQKVQATDITCGPGHGISIGSLGSGNSEAHVSDIIVRGAKLSGTTNGLRIKTWQGGSGNASNIVFQNVEMLGVKNPIIIDQNYCDQDDPCKEQNSAVQVKNVVYQNIKGSSSTNVGIHFNCSKSFPCEGIVMQNINLVGESGTLKAICNNVQFSNVEKVSPQCTAGESLRELISLYYNYYLY